MKSPKQIVQEAQDAFWAVVAAEHPHIKTGDFPVAEEMSFYIECALAVQTWVRVNTPTETPDEESNNSDEHGT